LVEWNGLAPTDNAVAIFETLDAEYPRREDGTWRIPHDDVAGVSAWIQRCGGQREGAKPASEVKPLRIRFKDGMVDVTTPGKESSLAGIRACGYGVRMGSKVKATKRELDEVEGSDVADAIVEALARITEKLLASAPLAEHRDDKERRRAAIQMAGLGHQLHAELKLEDTPAGKALEDTPPDAHVLVLSKDYCLLGPARMRTRDLPFHLLSTEMPDDDGLTYGGLGNCVLGLKYALGVDSDYNPATIPTKTPKVLLVGCGDSGLLDIEDLFAEQRGAFNVRPVNSMAEFNRMFRQATEESWLPDIVHFQGHSQNHLLTMDTRPRLSFRDIKSGLEACKNVGRPPSFCFLNTCNSATNPLGAASKDTLAEMTRDAGVPCIIGTIAKVHEGRAIRGMKEFATSFYRSLLGGRTVGQAVLDARRLDKEHSGHTWWRYILIGDPTTRLRVPE